MVSTKKKVLIAAISLAVLFGLSTVLVSSLRAHKEPTWVILGRVTDAETGNPIAGARVSDDDYGPSTRKETLTDTEGGYRHTTWPEEHNIVAQATGYQPQKSLLKVGLLGRESERTLDFTLVKDE